MMELPFDVLHEIALYFDLSASLADCALDLSYEAEYRQLRSVSLVSKAWREAAVPLLRRIFWDTGLFRHRLHFLRQCVKRPGSVAEIRAVHVSSKWIVPWTGLLPCPIVSKAARAISSDKEWLLSFRTSIFTDGPLMNPMDVPDYSSANMALIVASLPRLQTIQLCVILGEAPVGLLRRRVILLLFQFAYTNPSLLKSLTSVSVMCDDLRHNGHAKGIDAILSLTTIKRFAMQGSWREGSAEDLSVYSPRVGLPRGSKVDRLILSSWAGQKHLLNRLVCFCERLRVFELRLDMEQMSQHPYPEAKDLLEGIVSVLVEHQRRLEQLTLNVGVFHQQKGASSGINPIGSLTKLTSLRSLDVSAELFVGRPGTPHKYDYSGKALAIKTKDLELAHLSNLAMYVLDNDTTGVQSEFPATIKALMIGPIQEAGLVGQKTWNVLVDVFPDQLDSLVLRVPEAQGQSGEFAKMWMAYFMAGKDGRLPGLSELRVEKLS